MTFSGSLVHTHTQNKKKKKTHKTTTNHLWWGIGVAEDLSYDQHHGLGGGSCHIANAGL